MESQCLLNTFSDYMISFIRSLTYGIDVGVTQEWLTALPTASCPLTAHSENNSPWVVFQCCHNKVLEARLLTAAETDVLAVPEKPVEVSLAAFPLNLL